MWTRLGSSIFAGELVIIDYNYHFSGLTPTGTSVMSMALVRIAKRTSHLTTTLVALILS